MWVLRTWFKSHPCYFLTWPQSKALYFSGLVSSSMMASWATNLKEYFYQWLQTNISNNSGPCTSFEISLRSDVNAKSTPSSTPTPTGLNKLQFVVRQRHSEVHVWSLQHRLSNSHAIWLLSEGFHVLAEWSWAGILVPSSRNEDTNGAHLTVLL